MPRRKPGAPPIVQSLPQIVERREGPELQPHFEHRAAIGMLNSIKVLGPDMNVDEQKTRRQRQAQFDKIKHVLEDYAFCVETGTVIRVR